MKSSQYIRFCVFCFFSFVIVDSLNPQIQQDILDQFRRFSFTIICSWISFNSKDFYLKTSSNLLAKVSAVNLGSTENSSDKEVDF